MSFRIGIIGAGGIGEQHAAIATRAGLSVAGFYDIVEQRARNLASRYPGAVAASSVGELLALPDMPAVVVGVPNRLHAEMAIHVLRAGKDLLLEKPMAMNLAECDAIIEAMNTSGRLVQLGFVCRGAPTTLAAMQFIKAGRFGRIYHAKASLYRKRGIPGLGKWFTTRSQSGGGVLIDLGVHLIDLVMYLLGSPRPVRASGSTSSNFGAPIEGYRFTSMWAGPPNLNGVFDVDDHANALVRFEGGVTFELNTTWAANLPDNIMPNGVVLLGDKGGCYFDVWGDKIAITTEEEGLIVDVKPEINGDDPWSRGWLNEYELFKRTVLDRQPPHASPQAGRSVQAVIEAIYRSSAENSEVEIVAL